MSAPPIVVDASAVIALIRREPTWPAIDRVLRASARDDVRLLVTESFWLEGANVFIRRHDTSPSDVVEALRVMDELDIETVPLDRPMLLVTIDLQARHGLPAYDAAYLALAETEEARLLTLDPQLAKAARSRAIEIPGITDHHIAEDPATREPVDWARFGPYLARLRAEARELTA
jgi:predicted nucleic acid-binding protein